MRNLLPAMVLALAAAGVPASVGAAEMKSDIGAGEGQVDIVAWPGYIERGETDKNYDWVTDFEKKTGCKVNVKTAGTSDEMVALMNEGGFDLVTASGDASLRLIAGKRVQPINIELIPSWKHGRPAAAERALAHGRTASITACPISGAPTCSPYNTKVFKEAPKSWSVVFEEQTLPDGKSNKGRVQAFDGPIYIADAALYLMTQQARARHQGPLRAHRGPVQGGARAAARPAQAGAGATGTTPWSRSTTSRTRASSPRPPGRSRSTCCRARSSRSPRPSPRKAPPAGPTRP